VRDAERLERIRSIAVPPAWTDVWITADPDGHVQAAGRDARGRKQCRYHPDFRAERERTKFDDLVPFGESLGGLRRTLDGYLAGTGLTYERVVALVVSLLEFTHLGVGNECYVASNGTCGLTTLSLPARNGARVHGAHQVLGQRRPPSRCRSDRPTRVAGPQLPGPARPAALPMGGRPGYCATSHIDGRERLSAVQHRPQGHGQDIPTWGATLLAPAGFAAMSPPTTTRRRNASIEAVVEVVAEELGNTPTVARTRTSTRRCSRRMRTGRCTTRGRTGRVAPAVASLSRNAVCCGFSRPGRQKRRVA
jgi:DNA topoisomerase I